MAFIPPKAIDLERPALESVELCQALVRINTVNPYSGDTDAEGEAAGQDFLEPLLSEAGARTCRFDPPSDIYAQMGVLGPRGRKFDGRPNLVAEWAFGSGGPRVVIQGHMDTVGTAGMRIAPFSGELRDGRIWGRGASDMKGGLAAAVAAVRELVRARTDLHGSLVLMSVVDEECDGSGAGALACLARGYRGDVAICTDGMGPHVTRGYGGCLTARITVRSSGGGHAAGGEPGSPSALEHALAVADKIQAFKVARRARTGTAANLGVFHSGSHPSVVPTEAVLGVNIAYTLEEAHGAEAQGLGFGGRLVMDAFAEALGVGEPGGREGTAAAGVELEWVKALWPFATEADHPLVTELAQVHQAVLGKPADVTTNPAWSDACYLWRLGGVPTVVYGAGSPGQAHSPTECVEAWRIADCAKVLTAFLYHALRRP